MNRTKSRSALLGAGFALALAALVDPLLARQVLPKAGGEQQVNVRTFGHQVSPAIASDAHGNYAIVWLGPDEVLRTRLYLRLFDPSGAARTGEILVDQGSTLVDEDVTPVEEPRAPRLAMAPDGRFAVFWSTTHIWARLYDSGGAALGPRIRIDDVPLGPGATADLAMGKDGRFLATWLDTTSSRSIYVRAFDAAGQPLEAGRRIDGEVPGSLQLPRVVAEEGGGFVVAWARERYLDPLSRDDQVVAVLRSSVDGALTPEIQLNSRTGRAITTAVPAARRGGGFSVVWGSAEWSFPPDVYFPPYLQGRHFDAAGSPLTSETTLMLDQDPYNPPALASDPHGNTLVVVGSYTFFNKPRGQLFSRDWKPLGESFQVVNYQQDYQLDPVVASSGEGFVAAWASGLYPPFGPPPVYGQDGNGFGIFAQRFGPPLCVEGSKVLCLGTDGRFELSVDWKTRLGTQGQGRAHPLTRDSGAFWFFQPSNLELLTKVLDGRLVNDHFWFFSGALSDVDYTLTVRDSYTGQSRTYHNPQGTLASRADTQAFREEGPGPGLAPVVAPVTAEATACGAGDPSVLCLDVSRPFEITVDFVDPRTGLHGAGQAVPLTANAGAFTFFDTANLELVVKMLDGGPVNGKVWVFYGGLSDVEYTLTVKDVGSGTVRTYANVHGRLVSRADTSAFDTE